MEAELVAVDVGKGDGTGAAGVRLVGPHLATARSAAMRVEYGAVGAAW